MYFDINLSFFFNNFLKKNKKISKIYKENLTKCLKAADKLIIENKNKSNEILKFESKDKGQLSTKRD